MIETQRIENGNRRFLKTSLPINRHTVCVGFLVTAMFYVTAKLICNPMFFRVTDIDVFGYVFRFSAAALVYPLIYILSDLMVYFESKTKAIIVVIVGVLCDGFFSYAMFMSHLLPQSYGITGNELLHSRAVDVISPLLPQLWYHGIIATLIAGVAEILLFSYLFKRVKLFGVSTIISVAIVIAIHNVILDYAILKDYPDVIWRITSNYLLNIFVVIIYTLLISLVIIFRTKKSEKRKEKFC